MRQQGNTRLGEYNGLDKNDPLIIELNLQILAVKVCKMNYGFHRMISTMVYNRLGGDPDDAFALKIKALLDEGYY